MGRPKKSAPKHVEPEFESQDIPDEEPVVIIEVEPEPVVPAGAISQTDAARAALDKGYGKPAEAVKYILDTFGIEMTPLYFSSVKSRLKSAPVAEKAAPKGKPGRKPKATATATNGHAAPLEKARASGEPDMLESLETLKPLIASMGADKVKRLVDLLG